MAVLSAYRDGSPLPLRHLPSQGLKTEISLLKLDLTSTCPMIDVGFRTHKWRIVAGDNPPPSLEAQDHVQKRATAL